MAKGFVLVYKKKLSRNYSVIFRFIFYYYFCVGRDSLTNLHEELWLNKPICCTYAIKRISLGATSVYCDLCLRCICKSKKWPNHRSKLNCERNITKTKRTIGADIYIFIGALRVVSFAWFFFFVWLIEKIDWSRWPNFYNAIFAVAHLSQW